MDITLVNYMQGLLDGVPLQFKRYVYDVLPWNARMVGLTGPRGVGKSTIMLQRIKELGEKNAPKVLYVSTEHSYFCNHSLTDTADEFAREGGEWLFVDEVQKYEGWAAELMRIYDDHPDLHVFFSASSLLDLTDGETDLNRRALMFEMQGLSFREYLELFHRIKAPVRCLQQVLDGDVSLPGVTHPLPLFHKYLREGYYPFAVQGHFPQRLQQVMLFSLEVDIPQYANMAAATVRKLRCMFSIVAQHAPYKPEANSMANALKMSRNSVPVFLQLMERAGLIGQLRDEPGGFQGLGRTERVYLDNPNMLYAMRGEQVEASAVGETFFVNQLRATQPLLPLDVWDFCVNECRFVLRWGKEEARPLPEGSEAYVVRDDVEFASGGVLPLWSFGMLY
jgi:hypothetical protein